MTEVSKALSEGHFTLNMFEADWMRWILKDAAVQAIKEDCVELAVACFDLIQRIEDAFDPVDWALYHDHKADTIGK